ncbi:MAG TPA: PKD domain-containing protein [Chitinophagaceae bacterium]
MKFIRGILLFLPVLFHTSLVTAQANTYILNGSAIKNTCNCYTLTPAINTQSGSVWNATKINLKTPFDFIFNVYLGCADAGGADGIVFMLQPISTSVGTTGEGMGFEGISPSIGISLDTWTNGNRNDPFDDHISIQANGVVTHGNDLAGPVLASSVAGNIEDCQWHTLRISWDPATKSLKAYFDGEFRLESNVDLVATIFNNDPMVYWGFTAGTGGANNLQQFCTALNPAFKSNFSANTTCFGNAVIFTNLSESFAPIASYYWNFGDGSTSTLANPPTHNYSKPGVYEVKLAITALDGCNSDTMRKTIIIGDYPVARFDIYDTCDGIVPRIVDRSSAQVGSIAQWNWILDGNPVSISQLPQLNNLAIGTHQLQLDVKTEHGCASAPIVKSFEIKPAPRIEASTTDGCAQQLIPMNAVQLDNATSIASWHWDFGNGKKAGSPSASALYNVAGNYTSEVYAMASNGCKSNIVSLPLTINAVSANAGRDTMILKNTAFPLHSSFSSSTAASPTFQWEPPMFLDDPYKAHPVTTLADDQVYYFTVTSQEGCVARDTIKISVFKGSSIYVPNAFTPNNDGLNETLKPFYAGIKELDFFSVYNRWGQLVFTTRNMLDGWNGVLKGIPQATGTYVWMLRAVDYAGKVYQLKGTSTILR